MKAVQSWFVVLCAFVFAGISAGAAKEDEQTVSEWSKPSRDLQMRVTAPRYFNVGGDRDFSVKCEIKNVGKKEVAVLHRAKTFLVNDSAEIKQCLRYYGSTEIQASPVLKPGETTRWWQRARAPGDGTFKLYVCWDGDEGLDTPTVPITLKTAADAGNMELLRKRLHEHAKEFPAVVPNVLPQKATYKTITFTNDPVIANGQLWSAVRFVMPEQGGNLAFSYVNHFFFCSILPAEGPLAIDWYTPPDTRTLKRDVPGIGNKGVLMTFDRCRPPEVKPKNEYYFCFTTADFGAHVPSVTVSLNIEETAKPFSEIFSEMYDATEPKSIRR